MTESRDDLGVQVATEALAHLDRAAELNSPSEAAAAMELAKQYRMLADKLLPNRVVHEHPKSSTSPSPAP